MSEKAMTERREDIAGDSRARFEKWYSRGHKFSFVRRIDIPEAYEDGETEVRWYTWQAAERDTRERCAQIVESEPFAYITESEHEKLENFADRVRRRIRGKE